MVVKLQRDADDVIPLCLQQSRHNGGIDAAGHGDDNPRIFGILVDIECVQGQNPYSMALKAPINIGCFSATIIRDGPITARVLRTHIGNSQHRDKVISRRECTVSKAFEGIVHR
jgi:hypothetical protein